MHKIVFTLVLLSGLLFACGDGAQKSTADSKFSEQQLGEQQKMWDALMAVHDEVMPKISNIHKLSRLLRNFQETSTGLSGTTTATIDKTVKMLDAADESMFSWMNNLRQLKPLQDTEKHEDILKYLKSEQEKMNQVKEDMLNSIAEGKKLVEELEITNTTK